jgi:tetratricopeptide (TPR) repeat protein
MNYALKLIIIVSHLFLLLISTPLWGTSLDKIIEQAKEDIAFGNFEPAIRNLNKAIESNPGSAECFYYLGLAYWQMKNVQEALVNLNKAIDINPEYIEAYKRRVLIHLIFGNYERAIKDSDKAISLNPKDPMLYSTRCTVNIQFHNYEQAIKDCDKGIELSLGRFPFDALYIQRASVHVKFRNFQKAVEDCEKAITINPKSVVAYVVRGWVFDEQGKHDLALQDLKKALQLDPSFSLVHQSMAFFLATCKDSKYRDGKKAVEHAERALLLAEGLPKGNDLAGVLNTLAAAYAENGDFNRAVLTESQAYEMYKPKGEKDKVKNDYGELVDFYRNKRTYVQWEALKREGKEAPDNTAK